MMLRRLLKEKVLKYQVMINAVKFLITSILILVAHDTSASDTCEDYNTYEFFENIDYGRWSHCAGVDNGALNFEKDSDGSIPIFKSLGTDNGVFNFDNFLIDLNDEQSSEMFSVSDRQGRKLLHIAVEQSLYAEELVELLSWNLEPDQFAVNSSLKVIDKLALNDENSLTISALKIAGATISKDLPLSYSDNLALLQSDRWDGVGFRLFKQKLMKRSVEGFSHNFCQGLKYPEKLRELKSESMVACVDFPYDEYFDESGASFLHILAKNAEDPEVMDLFLGNLDEDRRKQLLDTPDKDGLKPIHVAAKYNQNPSILIRLVAWGADPDQIIDRKVKWNEYRTRNWKDRSIHFIAARDDDLSYLMMLTLLALGADPLAPNAKGETPLHVLLSIEEPYVPTLSLLLFTQDVQMGLFQRKLEEPKNRKGASPLLYATNKKLGDKSDLYSDKSYNDFSIIEKLLQYGANPDGADETGWSPILMYAVKGNDADTFALLLAYSQKACETTSKDGFTVLAALKENKHLAKQKYKDGLFDTSILGLFQKRCAN